MLKRVLLALTFVTALGAGGLSMSNKAEAGHGCGYGRYGGYGYGGYGYGGYGYDDYYPGYVSYGYAPRYTFYRDYGDRHFHNYRGYPHGHYHHGHHRGSGLYFSIGF